MVSKACSIHAPDENSVHCVPSTAANHRSQQLLCLLMPRFIAGGGETLARQPGVFVGKTYEPLAAKAESSKLPFVNVAASTVSEITTHEIEGISVFIRLVRQSGSRLIYGICKIKWVFALRLEFPFPSVTNVAGSIQFDGGAQVCLLLTDSCNSARHRLTMQMNLPPPG